MADDQPPPTYYDFPGDVILGQVNSAPEAELPLSQADQEFDDIGNADFSQQGLNFDLQKAMSDYLVEHPELAGDSQDELLETFLTLAPNVDQGLVSDTLSGILDNSIQGDPQIIQVSQASAADPVNLATGQFEHAVTDFTVRGAGLDFIFTRTYKSGVLYQGPLGSNWDHSANLWLRVNYHDGNVVGSVQNVTVTTGQLRPIQYNLNNLGGQSTFYVAIGDDNIVRAMPDGSFQKVSPSGLIIRFVNLTGDGVLYQVKTISDRFGNILRFQYEQNDSNYLLTSVTVNNAARIVSFSYDDLSRITSITLFSATYIRDDGPDSIARSWSYSYDDFGDLVAVTGPATDDFPAGRVTRYGYSSPSSFAVRPHDLLCITDANGNSYLENEYGSGVGTVACGRVVSQRVNDGVFLFEWQDVLQDPSWTYSDADCPTSSVTVVQRNGHSVCYTLSANGNILVSRESILGGSGLYDIIWRYAYDDDGRRVTTLSPQGRVTQSYYGREFYYDQNYPVNMGLTPPPPWMDATLSVQKHNTFSNVLATVRRGQLFSPLDEGVSIYDDIFTSVTTTSADDIIVQYTYEGGFQQFASVSDPRFTNSAVPGNGPPNLTVVSFDSADPVLKPTAIQYPDTRYPLPLGGSSGVSGAELTFDSYDGLGRLLQYTLPEGNSVAYGYYPHLTAVPTKEGFLASKTVGAGVLNLVTTFAINEAGQVTAGTDPLGNMTQFEIDPSGLVVKVTPPLPGFVITSSYDGNSQVTSRETTIIEPDGSIGFGSPEVAKFVYNAEMSPILTSVGDSSGAALRQTTRVYDPSNCLIRLVLPQGNSICYEYDERQLLKQVTRGCCSSDAATTAYSYDLDGLLIAVADPRGGVIASTLDAFGRPVGIVDQLGTLQRVDYDKLGNAIVRRWFGAQSNGTYPLLSHIEYKYDERGHLIRVRRGCFNTPIPTAAPWNAPDAEYLAAVAAGTVQLFDTLLYRDGNLRIFRSMDANGNATTFDYDAADRCVTVADPTGSSNTATYDGAGNIIRLDRYCADASATVRAVISTLYEFDAMNRLVAMTDGAGNTTVTGLDSRGLARTRTDALGNLTEWNYNPYRDRFAETQVLIPAGGGPSVDLTTSFSYDSNSNVIGVTDPRGNSTAMQYDLLDRLVKTINPDGTSRTVTYDRSGNQIKLVDEDGVVVNQTFDPLNNLVAVAVQPAGTPPNSAEQVASFSYNGVSVLVGCENAFATVNLNCDSLGRYYQEALTLGAPLNVVPSPLTIKRQFDAVSNLTQLSYPSGQVVGYNYDVSNRLLQINSIANAIPYPGDSTSPESHQIVQKAWWGNLLVSAQLGNGITIDSSYDPAARSISDGCTLINGDVFLLQQLWDGAGNRQLVVERHANRTNGWHYYYDSTNRFTGQATLRTPAIVAAASLAPPVTPLPRLALRGQAAIDAAINGYTIRAAIQPEFVYDLSGNRTNQRAGRVGVAYTSNSRNEYVRVGRAAYTYNHAGRMITDNNYDYAYNFRGQLVQAKSTLNAAVALEVFHDALGRVIGTVENGVTRVLVPNGRNAIETYDGGVLSAIYIHEGRDQVCFFAADKQDQYVLRDIIESTRLTSDADGSALGVFRYDPFGALLTGVPATPILYSGKYRYTSIGWYEYLRRQYIPEIGRFAQPDPAGFIDGANLYSFVGNNPLSGRDPSGATTDPAYPAAQQGERPKAPVVTDSSPDATDPSSGNPVGAPTNGTEAGSVPPGNSDPGSSAASPDFSEGPSEGTEPETNIAAIHLGVDLIHTTVDVVQETRELIQDLSRISRTAAVSNVVYKNITYYPSGGYTTQVVRGPSVVNNPGAAATTEGAGGALGKGVAVVGVALAGYEIAESGASNRGLMKGAVTGVITWSALLGPLVPLGLSAGNFVGEELGMYDVFDNTPRFGGGPKAEPLNDGPYVRDPQGGYFIPAGSDIDMK